MSKVKVSFVNEVTFTKYLIMRAGARASNHYVVYIEFPTSHAGIGSQNCYSESTT